MCLDILKKNITQILSQLLKVNITNFKKKLLWKMCNASKLKTIWLRGDIILLQGNFVQKRVENFLLSLTTFLYHFYC